MDKVEELIIKIDEMRKTMCDLIDQQTGLMDQKVVQASQNLDEVLNSYHKLLERKKESSQDV